MCATDTTYWSSSTLKTLTPPALRERNDMPATGMRIDWPSEVTSMISSRMSTGKQATSLPPRMSLSAARTP